MDSDKKYEDLDKRIKLLESKLGSSKDKPPKAPRKSSDYNIFVKDYIFKEKNKGTTKSHRELFTDAAKAWSDKK